MNIQTTQAPPPHIETLPDSTPLLAEPEKLRERWRQDGALYFKGIIGKDAVAAVHAEYLQRLKEMGVVDAGEDAPVWNGKDRLDGDLARKISDDVWRTMVADPSLDVAVNTFLGEPPVWLPIVVHRTAPPLPAGAEAATFGARHQDGIYNFGIDFVTCWVPLMDIDDTVGGLAVVPGSHKSSLYPPNVFADPNKRVGIAEGTIPDADWRRPDYKAGDLLMFHSMTAHAGLPNISDKFRLSMDIRFLPASVAPFVGSVVTHDEGTVELQGEDGTSMRYVIDENTIVRGPKGHPVYGKDRDAIMLQDADIIVMPDERGHAKLIRSVSRKFVDLPAAWYDSFPAGWVK